MILTLDIETIGATDEQVCADIIANLKAPANYKSPEAIQKWLDENKGDAIAKTSFDGAWGQVVCIGFKFDEEPAHAFTGDEVDILRNFAEVVGQLPIHKRQTLQVVGHNVSSFDMRFLYQRYIINQVRPPALPWKAKPWDGQIFDTMTEFAGVGNRISLDKLAKALGLEGKGEIDGSMVWPMYREGRIAEIAEYCKADVELTFQVFQKLTFVGV